MPAPFEHNNTPKDLLSNNVDFLYKNFLDKVMFEYSGATKINSELSPMKASFSTDPQKELAVIAYRILNNVYHSGNRQKWFESIFVYFLAIADTMEAKQFLGNFAKADSKSILHLYGRSQAGSADETKTVLTYIFGDQQSGITDPGITEGFANIPTLVALCFQCNVYSIKSNISSVDNQAGVTGAIIKASAIKPRI
jgi:hypothetical protein